MMTSEEYLTLRLQGDGNSYTGYYLQAIVLGYFSALDGTSQDPAVTGKYPRLGIAFMLGVQWAHQFTLTTKAR